MDRERQIFHKRHYGQEVGDPHHYDLVLNTGWSTHEAAAEVVIGAYRAKFGRIPDRP